MGLAECVALFVRVSFLSPKTIASTARISTSVIFHERCAYYATATVISKEEEENPKKEKGKWLTLPSFTSTINPTLVAKEISRTHNRSIQKSETTTTTALKWVLRCCPQLPRSLVQKLFRLRQVRRESSKLTSASDLGTNFQENRLKRVSAKDAMELGDRIFLPVSVREFPSEKQECQCSDKEINYIRNLELYRDPAIIVVNKPPGMPVQGGIGINKSLDVLAATYLRHDYPEPPRLVHRLDRDSSGILVMGRTQTSATVLHSIFREKTLGASINDTDSTKRILQRKYWALVIGTPRRGSGLISAPLGKVVLDNGKSEQITTINGTKTMSSQHAVTEYRVIESSLHGYTWLELCPLTGRKHQLRVHCAEVLGTPIVGDYKYGWQAHRKWKPMLFSEPERSEKFPMSKMLPFGLDLKSGSISDKHPHLHLHCKQMVLPNVSIALQNMQSSSNGELSALESLDMAAPLPSHMQRSWDILRS